MRRRKMSVTEYCDREFTPESRPCEKTVIRWIQNDIIEGVQIGKRWWVYETVTEADRLVENVLRSA
jgi:hypothetical protein